MSVLGLLVCAILEGWQFIYPAIGAKCSYLKNWEVGCGLASGETSLVETYKDTLKLK